MATIEIPLSRGKVVLIDEADWPLVSQHKWYLHPSKKHQYARAGRSGNKILLHRFIMDAPRHMMVDHIDGNGLNCTRANMRLCNNAQNQWNARRRVAGRDDPTGLHWNEQKKRWIAMVRVGSYVNREEARAALLAAKRLFYGEYAPRLDE